MNNFLQARSIATESITTLPQVIQTAISGLHTITDSPWWATIAFSTIFARVSLLPLVRTQVIASRKLTVAMPEISFLYQLLLKRLSSTKISNTSERLRILSVFFKGVNACLKLYEVSKVELIAYPFINIGVFMTFVYSVRNMIVTSDNYDMVEGGLMWFMDLSSKDATFILPISALSLSYCAMELGFGANKNPASLFLKDCFQSIVLLSLPFVAVLPAGVFCYWIPSSLFAIGQTQVLKSPAMLKLLKIPEVQLPPHLQPPTDIKTK